MHPMSVTTTITICNYRCTHPSCLPVVTLGDSAHTTLDLADSNCTTTSTKRWSAGTSEPVAPLMASPDRMVPQLLGVPMAVNRLLLRSGWGSSAQDPPARWAHPPSRDPPAGRDRCLLRKTIAKTEIAESTVVVAVGDFAPFEAASPGIKGPLAAPLTSLLHHTQPHPLYTHTHTHTHHSQEPRQQSIASKVLKTTILPAKKHFQT